MKMVNGLIEMDNMEIGNGITEMVDEYYGNTSQEFRDVMAVVLTANRVMKQTDATRLSDLSSDEKVAHEVLIEAIGSDSNALKVSKSFETWYESDDCNFDEFQARMELVELVDVEDEPEIEDELNNCMTIEDEPEPSVDLSTDVDDRLTDVEEQQSKLMDKMDSILDALEGLKSSKPSLPTKSNAKTATKTTTTKKASKVVEQPVDGLEILINKGGSAKTVITPSGWKNGQHSAVGVVFDRVHQGKPCLVIRAMDGETATTKGRALILRRIIQVMDLEQDNKIQNKYLGELGVEWTDCINDPSLIPELAEAGITTDVLDTFLTGVNKYDNQVYGNGRTADKLRTRLGITNTSTFVDAINNVVDGKVKPSKTQSKTPAPSNNEVATIDPAQLQQLVDGGMTVTNALAFLNNN